MKKKVLLLFNVLFIFLLLGVFGQKIYALSDWEQDKVFNNLQLGPQTLSSNSYIYLSNLGGPNFKFCCSTSKNQIDEQIVLGITQFQYHFDFSEYEYRLKVNGKYQGNDITRYINYTSVIPNSLTTDAFDNGSNISIYIERKLKNRNPTIRVTSPSVNNNYSTSINLSGSSNDADLGDVITIKYNIDGSSTQSVTGTITSDGTEKAFANTSIDIAGYPGGNHKLNVWAEDNKGGKSEIVSVNFTKLNLYSYNRYNAVDSGEYNDDSPWQDMGIVTGGNILYGDGSYVFNNTLNWYGMMSSQGYNWWFDSSTGRYTVVYSAMLTENVSILKKYVCTPNTNEWHVYQKDNRLNSKRYYQGTLVDNNVIAYDGTYPNNGTYGGYWYVKRSVVSNNPVIKITTPINNSRYSSEVNNNFISLSGSVSTTSTGNTISLFYNVDGSNTNIVPLSNNSFNQSINISDISEGSHVLNVWCKDSSNNLLSNVYNISFTVDKTSPDLGMPKVISMTPSTITIQTNAIKECESQSYLYNLDGNDNNSWTNDEVYTFSNLTPNTEYRIKYKAKDGVANISEYSDTITAVTLAYQPTELYVTETNDNFIALKWNANNNPEGTEYCVAAYDSKGNLVKQNEWTSLLGDIIEGLNPLCSYEIKVKARNKDNIETDSYQIETSQARIGSIKADKHGTYLEFSWSTLPGATGYDVEIDGKIESIGNKTSYTIKGLKPDTQHTFRVRAKNISTIGLWSNLTTVMTTSDKPDMPTDISYNATNTTITLNWSSVANAETYEIVELIDRNKEGRIINNGTATTSEIRWLEPSTSYTFKIRGVNSIGTGLWSDPISITTYLLDTTNNITTDKSDTSITLKWNNVKDADYYIVSIDGSTQVSSPTNSYTQAGLAPETQHKYSIKAVSSLGESGWSRDITSYTLPTKPAIPQNIKAVVSDISITITWDSVTSAEGYDVELDGILMEDDNDTIYIHDGLESDTWHSYRVRARNSAIEGDWSELRSITTLPGKPVAPKQIEVKSTSTGATLTWAGKASDISYDIMIDDGTRDKDGKPVYITIENIPETTYTHRRTLLGNEYAYYIRTRNKEGVSEWSGKIINNAIKAKCTKNKTVDLGLTAKYVTDFSAYTMVVTYNASSADVIDLSTLTGQYETVLGRIEGTDIEITDFTLGKITFKCDKVVNPGEAWTGVINSIKFKARATGGTTITYTVFCKEDD